MFQVFCDLWYSLALFCKGENQNPQVLYSCRNYLKNSGVPLSSREHPCNKNTSHILETHGTPRKSRSRNGPFDHPEPCLKGNKTKRGWSTFDPSTHPGRREFTTHHSKAIQQVPCRLPFGSLNSLLIPSASCRGALSGNLFT